MEDYNKLKKIIGFYGVDFKEQIKVNALGNYSKKIDDFFKNNNSYCSFEIINDRLKGSWINKSYKTGRGQTWRWIIEALYFWGLLDSLEYDEKSLLDNGLYISQIEKYNSFDEYLKKEALQNIKKNIKKDKEWYRKKVSYAFYFYIIKHKLKSEFKEEIDSLSKFIVPVHKSKYQNVFNKILLVFNDDNNEEIINELFKNKDQLINDGEYTFHTSKEVIALRRRFRDLLRQSQMDKIKEYENTLNENTLLNGFPHLEAAHLVSVWVLLKENNKNDIFNPLNGLFIDPNLHTMLDSVEKEKEKLVLDETTGDITYKGALYGRLSQNTIKEKMVFIKKSNKFTL